MEFVTGHDVSVRGVNGDPAGAAPASDPRTAMREARESFVGRFSAECAEMAALAEGTPAGEAHNRIVRTLHRMAGLGGTVGFPRVSARAAELEDALGIGAIDTSQLRAAVESLRTAFALDSAAPAASGAAPSADSAPLTVLLVEDDSLQRAVIAAYLKKAGHRPVEVASGEQTVATAREVCPDVILLDVEMPGVNGHDVCRLLKADPALASIPVAFVSAHTRLEDRLAGLSTGADDFLTKPIDPRELSVRLQLLNRRRSRFPDRSTEGVLGYQAFRQAAEEELARQRVALAVIRTPADKTADIAILVRDEIRRRDLCGQHDRSHVVVLLPDTSATSARDRIASIVEKCRASGTSAVYAGIAASHGAGTSTLDALLDEADEALAVARYEQLPAAIRPAEPRGRGDDPAAALSILIADDDPDVARILDAHLAAGGYHRTLVFDGSRALEELRASHPDVLILDLMMPRMTGFDVLAGIRNIEGKRPRVIVLSARGREEDVLRAFSLGADDFMTKPFNPQELLARVSRLVR